MESRRYLDADEAAIYTRLSKKTIYNWVSAHKIPFIKAGGRIIFSTDSLDAWLEEKSVGVA